MWLRPLLLLLPSVVWAINYKCQNDQVLVVQSFGNDTIRMHCQRLDLCGYQKLRCDYDEHQPNCGGQMNFVAHVHQTVATSPVEHTCCNLFNPRPPQMVTTHAGNDCFIYELPDGSSVAKPKEEAGSEPPLTVLKSAAEIPEHIDGISGYRLRLFLLKNKAPPTLLVKGIERRLEGYRVTICRPRCTSVAAAGQEREARTGTGAEEGSEWKAISWSSWTSTSWTTWARSASGNSATRVRTREELGSDKAASGSNGTNGGNVVNVDVDASGNNNNQWSEGGKGGFDRVTVNGGERPGDRPGNINITIHTQGSGGSNGGQGNIPSVVANAKSETHIHNHGTDGNGGSKRGSGDGDSGNGGNKNGGGKGGNGNGEDGTGDGGHSDGNGGKRDGKGTGTGGADTDIIGDGPGEGTDVNQKVSRRPPINGGNGSGTGGNSGEDRTGPNGGKNSQGNGNGNGNGDNQNGITGEPDNGDAKNESDGNGGKGGKDGKGDGKGKGGAGDRDGGKGGNGGDGNTASKENDNSHGGDGENGNKDGHGKNGGDGNDGGKGAGKDSGDGTGSGGKNGGSGVGNLNGNGSGGDGASGNKAGSGGDSGKPSGSGNGGDGNNGGNGGKGGAGNGGDANNKDGGAAGKGGAGGSGGDGDKGGTDGKGGNGGNGGNTGGKRGNGGESGGSGGVEDGDLTGNGGKDKDGSTGGKDGSSPDGGDGLNGTDGPNGGNGGNGGNGVNRAKGTGKGPNGTNGANGDNGKSGSDGSKGKEAVSGNHGGDGVTVEITDTGKQNPSTPSSSEEQSRQPNSGEETTTAATGGAGGAKGPTGKDEKEAASERKENEENEGEGSGGGGIITGNEGKEEGLLTTDGKEVGNAKSAGADTNTAKVNPPPKPEGDTAKAEQHAQTPSAKQPDGPTFKHDGVSPLVARTPYARAGVGGAGGAGAANAAVDPAPVAPGAAPAADPAPGVAGGAPAADPPAPGAPAADPPALMAAMQKMNCFAADSLVTTVTGKKRMDQLQVGDFVLVPSAGNVLKYERVEMFYHREAETRAQFVVLITENGRRMALTPLHLLPFGKCSDIKSSLKSAEGVETMLGASRFAYNAKTGDCVLSLNDNGELVADKIVKVGRQLSEGIYSPMTVEGALLVDGVLASCFSQLESHSVQKTVFDFLMFVNDMFGIGYGRPVEEQSVPSFVGYVHSLSQYVLPFAKY